MNIRLAQEVLINIEYEHSDQSGKSSNPLHAFGRVVVQVQRLCPPEQPKVYLLSKAISNCGSTRMTLTLATDV